MTVVHQSILSSGHTNCAFHVMPILKFVKKRLKAKVAIAIFLNLMTPLENMQVCRCAAGTTHQFDLLKLPRQSLRTTYQL